MHVSRYVRYSTRAISNSLHSLSSHSLPPLNTAHAQHMKYKHPNHLNHGQHNVTNIDTAVNIRAQCWCLLLAVNVYVACDQNS